MSCFLMCDVCNNSEILGENLFIFLFIFLLFHLSSGLNIHLSSLFQTPSIKLNVNVCDDVVLLK
jgi:hypothetical protein